MTSFIRAIRTGSRHEYKYDDKTILDLDPKDIITVDPNLGIKTDDLNTAITNSVDIESGTGPIIFTKKALQALKKIKTIERDAGKSRDTKNAEQAHIRTEFTKFLTRYMNTYDKSMFRWTTISKKTTGENLKPEEILFLQTDPVATKYLANVVGNNARRTFGKGRKHRTKHRRPTRRLKNRRTKRRRTRRH